MLYTYDIGLATVASLHVLNMHAYVHDVIGRFA